MPEKRDYYEVLGVSRQAGDDDVRKAYKQLALKYHPDRNPGDATAEAKFKEATEAYSVLNDPEKRATYDRFGHAGLGGGVDFSGAGVGDILNHFQDLFADFFGGAGFAGGGRGGGRQRGPSRGADVRVDVTCPNATVEVDYVYDIAAGATLGWEVICSGSFTSGASVTTVFV